MKMTLKTLPSGTIDLAFNGMVTMLQFNCSCQDALPYCNAMCCRMRSAYSTTLTREEVDSGNYETEEKAGLIVLQSDAQGNCRYLDSEGECSIHDNKPLMCKQWHCSPHGKKADGSLYEIYDQGFVILPTVQPRTRS